MLSLDSLLRLFNTLSQTNHYNAAMAVVLTIFILRNRPWRAFLRPFEKFIGMAAYCMFKLRRLPQWPVALGLLAILSILIVIAPASAQTLKGSWAPVSLSAPRQANDLVSTLPRANDKTSASRHTETVPARDGLLRKTPVLPIWILIIAGLEFTFSFLAARFKKAAVNLRDWFRYLYQLIDLPPPSPITVSA